MEAVMAVVMAWPLRTGDDRSGTMRRGRGQRPLLQWQRSVGASRGRSHGQLLQEAGASEVALLLLLFHARGGVVVDDATLAFGGFRQEHFLDDGVEGVC